ncbi:Transmembrane protein 17, partial [Tyrophagus putrescentiae]
VNLLAVIKCCTIYPVDVKIRCNLPLQICLIFNSYLFPIWCWLELSRPARPNSNTAEVKLQVFDFLWSASLLLMSTVEVVRLYVGHAGNKLEQLHMMLAFVFLSVFLQLPNHLFRLTAIQRWNWHSLPIAASSLIATTLLCIEIISSCWHIRTIFQRIYHRSQYGGCQAGSDERQSRIKSL